MLRWSLALVRRCPGGCGARREGCPKCIQITACTAEPDKRLALDKLGADKVLGALVGPDAATIGKPLA